MFYSLLKWKITPFALLGEDILRKEIKELCEIRRKGKTKLAGEFVFFITVLSEKSEIRHFARLLTDKYSTSCFMNLKLRRKPVSTGPALRK